MALPGPGGAALAFANAIVSGAGNNGDVNYGLDKLFGNGTGGAGSDLAVMPAVDAKQYNLSHFDNSDIWFKASNDQNVKTGWLGRWIDRNGSDTNPLQAVSIDTALSKAIRTAEQPGVRDPLVAVQGARVQLREHRRRQQPRPGHDDARPVRVGHRPRERVPRTLARDLRPRGRDLAAAERDHVGYTDADGDAAPAGERLSERHARHPLKTAATLLAANLGTRIITIHWGGFDTHTARSRRQDRQLIELSRALAAFRADLAARGSSSASPRSSSPSSVAASRRTGPAPRPAPTMAPAA